LAAGLRRFYKTLLASGSRKVFNEATEGNVSEPKANNSDYGQADHPLIFVVDDEPMLLELASVILEPLGYSIKAFRDPQLALDAFASAKPPPALVITDYAMHSMNGLTLMNACRKIQPAQKVMLVSGTVDESVFRHAHSKPDRFLAKPYQAKQLLEMVRELLAA
jgi:CheY-like chemotaxis protein